MSIEIVLGIMFLSIIAVFVSAQSAAAEAEAQRQAEQDALMTMVEMMIDRQQTASATGGGCLAPLIIAGIVTLIIILFMLPAR